MTRIPCHCRSSATPVSDGAWRMPRWPCPASSSLPPLCVSSDWPRGSLVAGPRSRFGGALPGYSLATDNAKHHPPAAVTSQESDCETPQVTLHALGMLVTRPDIRFHHGQSVNFVGLSGMCNRRHRAARCASCIDGLGRSRLAEMPRPPADCQRMASSPPVRGRQPVGCPQLLPSSRGGMVVCARSRRAFDGGTSAVGDRSASVGSGPFLLPCVVSAVCWPRFRARATRRDA
jgi:hypothetical protein